MSHRLIFCLLAASLLVSGCSRIYEMGQHALKHLIEDHSSVEHAPREREPEVQFDWPAPDPEFLSTFDPAASFPPDPNVTTGQLDNGLSYYIVPNMHPPHRVLLTLVVDAGSIDEDEDQLGVAHFVEHMLFNGTEHFSPDELRAYFEANGMSMGRHLNAFTNYDRTVFMLDLDTSKEEVLQTAFVLLEDWAAGALLAPEEVEKEKGVIEEEWRLYSQNAMGRLQDQIVQSLLGDSRYAARKVIGDMEVIRALTPEIVRRYYEDWYRPDLMSVLVIGDIDPGQAETLIQESLAGLETPPDARTPVQASIPLKESTSFQILSDPELTGVSFEVIQLLSAPEFTRLDDYRQLLIANLGLEMLNQRLAQIGRRSESAFQAAWVARYSPGIGGVSMANVSARLSEEKIEPGLQAVMTELRRAEMHGFSESEMLRAKRELMEDIEHAYETHPTRRSHQIQSEYLEQLLIGIPVTGVEFELNLSRTYLPDIELAEVHHFMEGFLDLDHSLVLLTAPEKPDLTLPTEERLASILDDVAATTPEPYVDPVGDGQLPDADHLLPQKPVFTGTVTVDQIEHLDLTVLTYENGLTAILKPTDLEENQVLFELVSLGGISQVEDELVHTAQLVTRIARESGVGPYDYDRLDRILTGRTVSASPFLGELTEGLSGHGTSDELDALFQLARLYMTQPRFTEDPFLNVLDNQRVMLRNQELDPFYALFTHISTVLYGDDPRSRPMTPADLETVDFESARSVHQDRFQALDAPHLFLVGDFDLEEAQSLIDTYMGTLPPMPQRETWRDRTRTPQKGPKEEQIYKGQGSQVVVMQTYINDQPPPLSEIERTALDTLGRILETRFTRELREELGGTYFANASIRTQKLPRANAQLSIMFATNEEQWETLAAASRTILEAMREEGVTLEEVETAKTLQRSELETHRTMNRYWLGALTHEYSLGDGDTSRIDQGMAYIDGVTHAQIQELMPLVIQPDQLIQLVMLPASSAPAD